LEVINFKQIPLGNLSAGNHEFYCTAYDDRGKSTKSSILPVKVYPTFIIDNNINDFEYSGSANTAFMISDSKLYVIDPGQEQLSKVIDLPYQDAIAISFATEGNNLYIAFKQGKLVSWNIDNQAFIDVYLTDISNLEDIATVSNNRMMMISNLDLPITDLTTGKIVNLPFIEPLQLILTIRKVLRSSKNKKGIENDLLSFLHLWLRQSDLPV